MDDRLNLQIFIDAAKAGGKIVRQHFGTALETTEKTNLKDIVTKADLESEEEIIALLKKQYPDFNIYGEETGSVNNGSEYTIVIDPLDGTSNFAANLLNFSVSIGVLKGDEAVLGVIYHPLLDYVYSAVKGQGAHLNGKQISVNAHPSLEKATISYGCGYDTPAEYGENLAHTAKKHGIKRFLDNWSPAYDLCLLASGKIEAIISNGFDFEDYVAGKAILHEAGGKITDFKGGDLSNDREKFFIATNGTELHQQLLPLL